MILFYLNFDLPSFFSFFIPGGSVTYSCDENGGTDGSSNLACVLDLLNKVVGRSSALDNPSSSGDS